MTGIVERQPCVMPAAGGPVAAAAGAADAAAARLTPEQQAAQQEQAAKLKAWRTSRLDGHRSRSCARCTTTPASPSTRGSSSARTCRTRSSSTSSTSPKRSAARTRRSSCPTDAAAQLKRIGDFAMKKKIYAAYHTHAQGSMTAFDQAFAMSKGNMANVDFGHWVAAGNVGGTPMQFLEKHHARIVELPPEGSDDAGALRAQPAVGHGRDADQGDPPAGEEEQVEDPGVDRARIRHPRRLGRRAGSRSAWSTAGRHSRSRASEPPAVGAREVAASGWAAMGRALNRPVEGRQTFTNLSHPPRRVRDTVLNLWSESALALSCWRQLCSSHLPAPPAPSRSSRRLRQPRPPGSRPAAGAAVRSRRRTSRSSRTSRSTSCS